MHHSKLCKECSLCSALCQIISSALGEGFERHVGRWKSLGLLQNCDFQILTKHALNTGSWKLMEENQWSFLLHPIILGWSCLWGSASLTGVSNSWGFKDHSPSTGEEGQGIHLVRPHELKIPMLCFCMEQCRRPCKAWYAHNIRAVCSILLKTRAQGSSLGLCFVCLLAVNSCWYIKKFGGGLMELRIACMSFLCYPLNCCSVKKHPPKPHVVKINLFYWHFFFLLTCCLLKRRYSCEIMCPIVLVALSTVCP